MEQSAMTYGTKPTGTPAVAGTVKARQAERYRLKQGFVAFSATNFCEIRNISKTGIGLQYLAHKESSCDEMSEISLLNNLEGYMLNQLSCRIVYVKDIAPAGEHAGQSVIRKIGLQFVNLSDDQQEQITDLLSRYSTEKEIFHH